MEYTYPFYIIQNAPLFQLSLTEKEALKESLKMWVAGFSWNSGGNPYLLEEHLRVVLLLRAPVTVVVTSLKAQPVLDRIRKVWPGLERESPGLRYYHGGNGERRRSGGSVKLLGSEVSNVPSFFGGALKLLLLVCSSKCHSSKR